MADGGSHPTHLAVFALYELKADPAIGDGFSSANGWVARRKRRLRVQQPSAAWEGSATLQDDPALQAVEVGPSWNTLDLCPVGPWVTVARVEQAIVPLRLVAEQEQPFRIGIEPPDRVHGRRQAEAREGLVW